MKQFILFSVLCAMLFSCSGSKKQEIVTNFELDELLKVAETKVDSTITVKGYVTHVCVHSGQRCFIVGESQNISIRIEAGEKIGTFDRELVGAKIAVNGVLKERRLSQEYIDNYEKEVKLKEKEEDGSAATCAAELSNINDMRKWMQENKKDYFVIYYMDGLSYEKLEIK